MKRIIKHEDSPILKEHLSYPKHSKKISKILQEEQQFFCAYTEERISPAFSVDIEHFNSSFKGTTEDGYNNWFAVSHIWNIKKPDERWNDFQPILYPTDPELETRLFYSDGFYVYHPDDIEAKNLKDFLDINNDALITERQNYIKRLKWLSVNINLESYLKNHNDDVRFRRALKAEFGFEL